MVGLTRKCCRKSLSARSRGRSNTILPGTIDIPTVSEMVNTGVPDQIVGVSSMFIGRLGRPSGIATAVLWQCGSGASSVTGAAYPWTTHNSPKGPASPSQRKSEMASRGTTQNAARPTTVCRNHTGLPTSLIDIGCSTCIPSSRIGLATSPSRRTGCGLSMSTDGRRPTSTLSWRAPEQGKRCREPPDQPS